jgi:hypothetical protein
LVPWSYWSSRLCLLAWQCASDRPRSRNQTRDYVGCNWPSVGSTLVGGANPLTTPSWAETGPAVPDRQVTALADEWTGRNPARTLTTSYSSLRQFTKLEPGVRVREFSEPESAICPFCGLPRRADRALPTPRTPADWRTLISRTAGQKQTTGRSAPGWRGPRPTATTRRPSPGRGRRRIRYRGSPRR